MQNVLTGITHAPKGHGLHSPWGFTMVAFVFLLSACATTKVKRVDVNQPVDLSGDWNDYDATLIAREMIADCLSRPWLTDFLRDKGRNPAVILGQIVNHTSEHINAGVVTSGLERELLNSGKVVFVASPQEREQLRVERTDQQKGLTDPDTMAKIGKERGADYMMIGTVNSVTDEMNNKAAVFYQVNLELIDLSTNTKVWIGQKEIKKTITRSRFGF
jgi:penicillin-binding protein activator